MDLNDFKNVSDKQFLKSTWYERDPKYYKEIIVTTSGVDHNNQVGDVHKYEIFENIYKSNQVIFTTKVMNWMIYAGVGFSLKSRTFFCFVCLNY